MNKIISVLALGLAAIATTGCSNIDENDRLIYVEPATVSRCVLIEDFTGQACINCPVATDIIHELQKEYGDNVIAVGLHGGPFAKQNGRPLPLYSETADYLYSKFGAESQPAGMIDRQGVIYATDLWPTKVREEISKESPLKLSLANTYESGSRTLEVAVTIDAILDINGNLNVWLTENNIISPQYLPDGSADVNYEHNHVFRATLTGNDGTPITVKYNESKTIVLSIAIDEAWVSENMDVVAFVDNANGVQQATKASVIAVQ